MRSPASESKEHAIARMIQEYSHIGEHDNVIGEAKEEAEEAQTTRKSPHSGKSAILLNPRNLLQ